MSAADDEVYRFIFNEIDSIPQLEALLLLWQSRPEQWSAERLAARLFIQAESAAQIGSKLFKSRFISYDRQVDRYWYESDRGGKDELIESVALIYSRELVRVSKLIHNKRSSSLDDFSRAFRLARD